MDFSTLQAQRKSIRDFQDKPVPTEVLDAILDDAFKSPSWSNTQPYRIAVAQGESRDALAKAFNNNFDAIKDLQHASKLKQLWALLTNPQMPKPDYSQKRVYPPELQERRLVTAKGLYGLLGIERHDTEKRDAQLARNFEFFGAPVGIFIFTHQGLGAYSVLDAGIFLQSLMLSAESRGLATCAQGALAQWRKPVAEQFDIPKDYKLLCGVSLGYASDHQVNSYQPGRLGRQELVLKQRT